MSAKMECPDDVLSIITEFSMPITRSNWRNLRRMTSEEFHFSVVAKFNSSFNVALIHFLQTQSSNYVYTVYGGFITEIITPKNRKYYIKIE
jgi:hypothetical protein